MGRSDVLAEIMLWLMAAGLVAVIAAVVWSAVLTTRKRLKNGRTRENLTANRVAWGIAVGTSLLLLLTFILASTAALNINGKPFTDAFWLRMADMFIITVAVLFVVALIALVFSKLRIKN